MGQVASNGSNYVVEIAPGGPTSAAAPTNPSETAHSSPVRHGGVRSGGWQPVPTSDTSPKRPAIRQPLPWRITVNPQLDEQRLQIMRRYQMESMSRSQSMNQCRSDQYDQHEQHNPMLSPQIPSISAHPHQHRPACSSNSDTASSTYTPTEESSSSRTSSPRQNVSTGDCPIGESPDSAIVSPTTALSRSGAFQKMSGFSSADFNRKVTSSVDRLYGRSKLLTDDEANVLVLALQANESDEVLLKALTAVSNLAAFASNQELFRQNGCNAQLKQLLCGSELSPSIRVMLTQAIGNMAVNDTNLQILQDCVPPLCHRLSGYSTTELEKLVCAQTLSNLSYYILPEQVQAYTNTINSLFARIWTNGKLNVTAVRLLINITCCHQLVPYVLAAKAPPGMHSLLDHHHPEDTLVRSATLLMNLCADIDTESLQWSNVSLCRTDPAVTQSQSVFHVLTCAVGVNELLRRCKLLRYHPNEDIAQRCQRLMVFCHERLNEHDKHIEECQPQ